jgi:hypothetical protein
MANRSRRRRARTSNNRRHKRSRNPLFARKTRVRRYRRGGSRRSNPGVAGFNATELVKLAAGGAAGAVGSKMLSQAVLGSNNAGYTGALGQAAASVALAWAANKAGLGKDVATGVLVGGLSGAALNLVNLYMGMGPSPQSGLGDPLGAALLGDFVPGSWNTPSLSAAPVQIVKKTTNGR